MVTKKIRTFLALRILCALLALGIGLRIIFLLDKPLAEMSIVRLIFIILAIILLFVFIVTYILGEAVAALLKGTLEKGDRSSKLSKRQAYLESGIAAGLGILAFYGALIAELPKQFYLAFGAALFSISAVRMHAALSVGKKRKLLGSSDRDQSFAIKTILVVTMIYIVYFYFF